jgi:hypothetical protein
VAALLGAREASAQTAPRVTILTVKQEKIEGAFKGATATEVVIELAGQELRIPTSNIAYVSFTGDAPAAGAAAAAPSKMDTAFAAFAELNRALAVGVLRDQYSERLVATMSKVVEFTGGESKEWLDIRLAMYNAMEQYKEPLAKLENWKDASLYFGRAMADIAWAETLRRRGESERTHVESPNEKPLALNQDVGGRLGFGDRVMSREIDKGTENAYNDVWTFEVTTVGTVTIEMAANAFDTHLTLLDASGKKLDSDLAFGSKATIKRRLGTGKYVVWAGSWKPRDVGNYTIRALLTP